MIEPYENTLDLSALRREVRAAWGSHAAFVEAIRMLPDMAEPEALWHLVDAAMAVKGHHLWQMGKEAQRSMGLSVVPPKSELENAAGLWIVIRDALRSAQQEAGS